MAKFNLTWGNYLIEGLEDRPHGVLKNKWKKYRLVYRLDVYKELLGQQVDHVWYTEEMGFIYAYQTVTRKSDLIYKTDFVLPSGGSRFYDSFDDAMLGGRIEKLGG